MDETHRIIIFLFFEGKCKRKEKQVDPKTKILSGGWNKRNQKKQHVKQAPAEDTMC